MRKSEYLVALGCFAVVFALTALFLYPGLVPGTWQDFCEAARVRPPENPFPGLWRLLATELVGATGVPAGLRLLRYLGPASAGFLSGLLYLSVREALPNFLRFSTFHPQWEARIERLIVVVVAVVFGLSTPIHDLTQAFASDTLHMLLAFFAVWMMFRYSRAGNANWIYGGLFLCGLLAAETPVGVLLTGLYILFVIFWPHTDASVALRFAGWDPVAVECVKWKVTMSLAAGFCLAIWADVWSFERYGGLVQDLTLLTWAEKWIVSMGLRFMQMGTRAGWLMFVFLGALPVSVAWKLLPRTTNDEKLMSYGDGLSLLVLGLFALLQLVGCDALRYVNWFVGDGVGFSPVLCAFASFFAALTLVTALVAVAAEIYCRNSAALIKNRFPESAQLPFFVDLVRKTRFTVRRYRRWLAFVLPALLLLSLAPRLSLTDYRVYRTIREYLNLVLDEAVGLRCVFSDGHFDAALELLAAERGESLVAHALFGRSTPYRRQLRMRTAHDAEDEAVAEVSSAAILKNWVEERTNRLETAGAQVGFEMWRRKRLPVPKAGGTMVRTAWPEGLAEDGAAVARELGERMMRLYRKKPSVGRRVQELFDEIAWRLTRLARLRAFEADGRHDLALARAEQEFADELDELNPSVAKLREALGNGRSESSTKLSPREGLRVALARPDFRLARQFAQPILAGDPDDADANFAVGMAYAGEEQWTRAEDHLKRSLIRRPNEPAVFNNLAAVCYKMGRYVEAEEWAKKAAERLPDSPEVRETLRSIRKKLEER